MSARDMEGGGGGGGGEKERLREGELESLKDLSGNNLTSDYIIVWLTSV